MRPRNRQSSLGLFFKAPQGAKSTGLASGTRARVGPGAYGSRSGRPRKAADRARPPAALGLVQYAARELRSHSRRGALIVAGASWRAVRLSHSGAGRAGQGLRQSDKQLVQCIARRCVRSRQFVCAVAALRLRPCGPSCTPASGAPARVLRGSVRPCPRAPSRSSRSALCRSQSWLVS